MVASESAGRRPGLRERKKARTRATLRRVAFRLFREQGFAETTIEQIADEADVSPSTFFRYFPTKEALVLADDLDPPMIAAFEEQPAEITVFDALRRAFENVLGNLTEEEIAFERERQELAFSVPELRRAALEQMIDSIELAAELVSQHTRRAADDFEVRALAGAMIGSVLAVAIADPGNLELAMRAMQYVRDGLPLGHATVAGGGAG